MFLEVRNGVVIGLCFWRKCGKYLTNMTIYIYKKIGYLINKDMKIQ